MEKYENMAKDHTTSNEKNDSTEQKNIQVSFFILFDHFCIKIHNKK